MKVRFLETYQVKDEEGRIFQEGEIYDLPDLSAKHFLRKGRAEIVKEGEVKTEVEPVAPKTAINQPEEKLLGGKGGDPVEKFKKGQRAYTKRALKGEDL